MFSQMKRLLHWGPIAVLGIIKLITCMVMHLLEMWWPPFKSPGGLIHAITFLSLSASILYCFLQALITGPGFVPIGWKPENESDTDYLQFCTVCKGYKAPRSHHCRKCGHCVKKMDHHCPWINCCVGHDNHCYFTLFLITAVLGCLHASIVLSVCLYHAINRVWYVQHGSGREPMIYLTLTSLLLTLLATGMAVGVVLAVGALLYLQIRGILKNRTTIEDWIVEKAVCRREERGLPPFVFPYDRGWRDNLRLLYDRQYDGVRWPVLPGSGEYDLTIEQKAQKLDKQMRSRMYMACRDYSGRWMPLVSYPRAALGPPCTDEQRIALRAGDLVRATRQRRHWLFGEKVSHGDEVGGPHIVRGPRGWFPRAAAVPARCGRGDAHSDSEDASAYRNKHD